jgi:hypothetical protein
VLTWHPFLKIKTVGNSWMMGYLDPQGTPTLSTKTCPCQAHQLCQYSSPWKQKE